MVQTSKKEMPIHGRGKGKMRPDLKTLNADLSKTRRKAAEAKDEKNELWREAYAMGKRSVPAPPQKLLKGIVKIDAYEVMSTRFDKRFEYAKEFLAEKFVKELKDYIEIEHVNTPNGEIWKGMLAVGGIVRVPMSLQSMRYEEYE